MRCVRYGAQHDPVGRSQDDPVLRAVLPVGRTALPIAAGRLGLFALLPPFAPLALVMGVAALVCLKRRPDAMGLGRAIFGVVMGAPMSAVLLCCMVAIRPH